MFVKQLFKVVTKSIHDHDSELLAIESFPVSDVMEHWNNSLGSQTMHSLRFNIQQYRLARFKIWNSFYFSYILGSILSTDGVDLSEWTKSYYPPHRKLSFKYILSIRQHSLKLRFLFFLLLLWLFSFLLLLNNTWYHGLFHFVTSHFFEEIDLFLH